MALLDARVPQHRPHRSLALNTAEGLLAHVQSTATELYFHPVQLPSPGVPSSRLSPHQSALPRPVYRHEHSTRTPALCSADNTTLVVLGQRHTALRSAPHPHIRHTLAPPVSPFRISRSFDLGRPSPAPPTHCIAHVRREELCRGRRPARVDRRRPFSRRRRRLTHEFIPRDVQDCAPRVTRGDWRRTQEAREDDARVGRRGEGDGQDCAAREGGDGQGEGARE